ncbi:class I SAM-dependent methyltransferase [Aliikangiella maris]|uniref:Cyclopropane-fatty-acyl-phospholipid synthase family protein n=2 Tax=Aliikangiella maris TaxID=3162458 RepID=A0ABV2BSJ3_9GAMM
MNSVVSIKNYVSQLAKKPAINSDFVSRQLKQQILKKLRHIEFGQLTLTDGDETHFFIGKQHRNNNVVDQPANKDEIIKADLEICDPQFYQFIAFGGSLGAGEAYINGFWRSKNLTRLIQLFALNQSVIDNVDGGLAHLSAPLKRLFHWLNKNTLSGSKKNIVAHYDLGNDFFKLFLDPSMMYSSGIFTHPDETMAQASHNKLQRIAQQLNLSAADHIVEIGTGWGGFAVFAAKNYGCKVTTTTISEEQYQYTRALIQSHGLTDKITLLKQDYRELTGQFDKLVSIEMIEAVGHHYFATFFEKCNQLLKPDGQMLIQAITILDQKFDRSKDTIDYIKRYVFPGSCIPSVQVMNQCIQSVTDMRVHQLFDIGLSYALTLQKWREQFFENIAQVKALGFDDSFIRLWEFYLCYCEGGFRERVISNVQLHAVKPLARPPLESGVKSNL